MTAISIGQLVDSGEASIQTGPFGTQLKASDYVEGGVPVINVRNIGYSELRASKLEYVTDATRDRLGVHVIADGDIVFGRKGAVDRHLFVGEDQAGWLQGSDCIRLRLRGERVLPRYLSYALLRKSHMEWMLSQCGNKATMASLNQDVVGRIEFALRPLGEQHEIVRILSKYDDLIANNKRRIELLEQSARLLFKEWFVHLHYPGHEHDKIVRGVPEGWERKPIADLTSFINRGITPKYDDDATGLVINQKCIRDRLLDMTPARRQSKTPPDDKLVRPGDVLVNSTGEGTLGRVAQVFDDLEHCTVDSHVTIVRARDKTDAVFIGLHLTGMETYLASQGRGATNQKELSRATIGEVQLVVPPERLRLDLSERVSPHYRQISILKSQCRALSRARDLLLPRLMDGRISV